MTNIPSPEGQFLLGNLREFQADTLGFLKKLDAYGDLVRFQFGPFPVYYTRKPEYIHQVLVTDARSFQKSQATKKALRQVVGNGIFTSDGDFWKRQRKLVQPAFHSQRIGAYADVMVDFAEKMLGEWQDGETRDIGGDMAGVTMNIISKTMFDAEMESDLREIKEAVVTALEIVDDRFNTLLPIPDWLPIPRNVRMRQAVASMDRTIQRFVDERRASGEDKGDLLSMLLAAQDEDGQGMTDQQVRDECMTLFGAGHETTAVTLTWALYALSQYPDSEARLHAEIDRVLGQRRATLADLPNLPYTEMVIKETLRFFPPAWGTTRQSVAPVQLGPHTLPANSVIFLGLMNLHHDARYFPDPEHFDPERFSPEREKDIARHTYLPFGAGPRVCVGNMFAMMEAQLVLATIAQRYKLRLVPGHPVVPDRVFTLRPKYGVKMIVSARKSPLAASPTAATTTSTH